MFKRISILLCFSLLICLLAGCGGTNAPGDGRLKIVATIFPEYDWVVHVLGEKAADAELTLLLDDGVDLHSYQPSVQDMVKIAECDLFLYVGGTSDKWIEDALSTTRNENRVAIDLLEVLGDAVKEEEITEGMQAEDEEEAEGPEYDEHVWLSLRNAILFVESIAEHLSRLDEANSGVYRANADAYVAQLRELDAAYSEAVRAAGRDTLLFADRFPFRYLTDDYGLTYYAAFVGCSAETEASFETITFLSGKLRSLELKTVLTIETGDDTLARAVIEASGEADVQILQLDSMQSTSLRGAESGVGYLEIMRSNLEVLRQALA